jgi:hypothetical protein
VHAGPGTQLSVHNVGVRGFGTGFHLEQTQNNLFTEVYFEGTPRGIIDDGGVNNAYYDIHDITYRRRRRFAAEDRLKTKARERQAHSLS